MTTLGKQKILKQINRKHILNILRDHDEISVAQLSQDSNLSKPTIMKIMKYYIEKGFVVVSGKGNSTEEGGKKPNIFKFNANGAYAIGMIITANKLKAAITNLRYDVVDSCSIELIPNEDVDSVVDKISKLFYKLIENNKIESSKIIGIAIGIYGLTDFDDGVVFYSPHYSSWGKNIRMREKIKKKIPENVPIILDNISRFQVFAEKTLGSAKDVSNIISLMAGYGLGAGVIIENDIKRGYHKIMGEVGHMVINPSEEIVCACGSRGCFEVMVSIDRLKKIILDNKSKFPDSIIFNKSNDGNLNDLAPEDIFEAYKKNDKLVVFAMNDIINWFAVGISNIILIYDPQVIVIYGIYTRAGENFLRQLRKKVKQISLTSVRKDTKIKFSELGEMSGVLGAAAYVINNFFK